MYTSRLRRFAFCLPFALALTACATPAWLPIRHKESGRILNPGEQATLHFFTREAHVDTGLQLQAGAAYQLNIKLLSYWIDGTIDRNELASKLDEKGFANSVMPAQWMGWLRRSRTHNWFELMLVQRNCKSGSLKGISDIAFDEASGSYNFVATCDGNLSLFVNDSHGFYSNNAGYANIALSRVN